MIGKNATKRASILHADRNVVEFSVDDTKEFLSLTNHDFLSHLPLTAFVPQTNDEAVISCLNGSING